MNEEALRQHFLMQLNGQFEGQRRRARHQHGGQTDILLREGDRNVFIAECKFWKGPGRRAINVSCLRPWRDSKTAISSSIVAPRPQRFSGVDAAAKAHGNFKP